MKRNNVIIIKVNDLEKQRIKCQADELGLSVSATLRLQSRTWTKLKNHI